MHITAVSDGNNYSYSLVTKEGVKINVGECKDGTFDLEGYGKMTLNGSFHSYKNTQQTCKCC